MTTPPTLLSPETLPSSETKPEGEAKPEVKAEPEAKPGEKPEAKPGVPEKYEDFKVPEGVTLDKAAVEAALPIFKELGLSQESAQKLVDLQTQFSKQAADAAAKSYWDMRADWQSKAKALPEIGKELGPGGKVVTTIARALDQTGDATLVKDFKDAMNLTGAGDHPAFIQLMYRWASKLTEGGPVNGRGPSPLGQAAPGAGRKSPAQEIYPTLPSGA